MDPAPLLLNVDDDSAGRYVKTRVLTQAGFRTIEAASGEQALLLARTERPDLVVLDVRLPDIDGLQVCEMIKKEYPAMCVLQVSATYVEVADRIRGLACADAYLTEPIEPQELIATVKALLRMRKAEQGLRIALEKNKLLLAELQHRIKNSLQLVSSVLALEATKIKDPEAKGHFETARDRIAVVGRLYDLLYSHGQADRIDISELLKDLAASFRALAGEVEIRVDAGTLEIGINEAIPLGLIVQELVTNALKHAFPSGRRGRITIELTHSDTTARIAILDDGIGPRRERPPGSGLKMVRTLVSQLGGSFRWETGRDGSGTSASVRFPVPESAVISS